MTTAYWRCKERVYFDGLETGLEKAVLIQVIYNQHNKSFKNRGMKVNTVLFLHTHLH